MTIPLEYLTCVASENILGEYQLKHLDAAARIDKQIRELMRLYIEEMSAAGFALFMREHREELLTMLAKAREELAA